MKFHLSFELLQKRMISIKLTLPAFPEGDQEIWLPKWRPGRYELARYAENISDLTAQTVSGKPLSATKSAYNKWVIEDSAGEVVEVSYQYYAIARDGGGSYFDEKEVYVNGINCLLYREDLIDQPCDLELVLPEDFQIACGLRNEGNLLLADSFHQLVDAPILAGNSLQHFDFDARGIPIHLWFSGEVKPDVNNMREAFHKFALSQLDLFGDFPATEYHFLFIIHNQSFYHGVEHFNSTVIAIGPGARFMRQDLYEEVLGVSSHELFHTWNVKQIRPADMLPYDYDGENYSRLHYITEGVTTYYGDLMLFKSGVWKLETYLRVFSNSVLKRHFANHGHRHLSLEQASFDSWVSGYKHVIPNRRISFYTKGALVAFIFDQMLREATGNEGSLDTVMFLLYQRFGKVNKGYTGADYQALLEEVSGLEFTAFFEDFISGTSDLVPALNHAASYYGLKMNQLPPNAPSLALFGFMADESDGKCVVGQVHEESPAESAGLRKDDWLVAVNGMQLRENNLQELIIYFREEEKLSVHFFRNRMLNTVTLIRDPDFRSYTAVMSPDPNATEAQLENRRLWAMVKPVAAEPT